MEFSYYWIKHAAHKAWTVDAKAYDPILDVDIRALGELLETVLLAAVDAKEAEQLFRSLPTIADLVDDGRWKTRIAFIRVLYPLYRSRWDENAETQARKEFRNIDIESVRDDDILRVHFSLFASELGLSALLRRLDTLIELSTEPGLRLQYRRARAMTLCMYNDPIGAKEELEAALDEYHSSEGAKDSYGLDQYANALVNADEIGLELPFNPLERAASVLEGIIDSKSLNNRGVAECEFQLGTIQARARRWEAALAAYRRAQSHSHREDTLVFMAETLAALGRNAEALGVLHSLEYESLESHLQLVHCLNLALVLHGAPGAWETSGPILVDRLKSLQPRDPASAADVRKAQALIESIVKQRTDNELASLRSQLTVARNRTSDDSIRAAVAMHQQLPPARQTMTLPLPEELTGFVTRITVHACARLMDQRQLLSIGSHSQEDTYTAFLLSLLQQRIATLGWSADDQQHGGLSGRDGPERGRRDLVIWKGGDAPFVILEALRTSSMATTAGAMIDEHLHRLIIRYNRVGAEVLIVLVFAEVSDFSSFYTKYREHLSTTKLKDSPTTNGPWVSREWTDNGLVRRNLKLLATEHALGNETVKVIHILLHLPVE